MYGTRLTRSAALMTAEWWAVLARARFLSFHATKFLNSFGGGALVTNDDALAAKTRLMRNFGFAGYDNVIYLGTNGKMTEICAAMGLTSLDALDELVAVNRRNYGAYQDCLRNVPGVALIDFPASERNNYQYVVLEVDPGEASLDRDELIAVLHAENVLARKYFWPGCHRMEPYRSLQPNASLWLPVTERISERILVLPTGQAVTVDTVVTICDILRSALGQPKAVRSFLRLVALATYGEREWATQSSQKRFPVPDVPCLGCVACPCTRSTTERHR